MPEERISSPRNPWVKRLRRLHRRQGRRREGRFFAEGTRLLEEARRSGWRPERLFYAPGLMRTARDHRLVEAWRQDGIAGVELDERLFAEVADTEAPQGVLAVFAQPARSLADLPPVAVGRYLLLEDLQDPGNLGVLLRTAQAAGVDGAILLGGVDPFHPKAVRSSMGAIFALPTTPASFSEVEAWRRRFAAPPVLVAAVPSASRTLYDHDWRPPFVLAVGNEVGGLSPQLVGRADVAIRIPMPGGVESLNTAVAGSILLYEALRRHGAPCG